MKRVLEVVTWNWDLSESHIYVKKSAIRIKVIYGV
jgi:hypothetical protein